MDARDVVAGIPARIRQAIASKGLSLRAFSDELVAWSAKNDYWWPGAPRSSMRYGAPTHATLSNYQVGNSLPQADFLVALCEITQTNPYWLLFGKGEQKWRPGSERERARALMCRWLRDLADMVGSREEEEVLLISTSGPEPAEDEDLEQRREA